ncbi:hypothetical protein V6N13_076560 [Hibiscus sabdariffa]
MTFSHGGHRRHDFGALTFCQSHFIHGSSLLELAPVRGSRSSEAFSCLSFIVIATPALENNDGALGIVTKTPVWWILSRSRPAVSSYNPQASCFLLFSSSTSMSVVASFVQFLSLYCSCFLAFVAC